MGDIGPLLATADRFDAIVHNPDAYRPDFEYEEMLGEDGQVMTFDQRKAEVILFLWSTFKLSDRESLALYAIIIQGIDEHSDVRRGSAELLIATDPFLTGTRKALLIERENFIIGLGVHAAKLFRPEALKQLVNES